MNLPKISSYFMFETGSGLFHLQKMVGNHGSIVSPIVASSQVSLQNPRAFRDLVETSGFC